MPTERCGQCGFDSEDWSDTAALDAISRLPFRWNQVVAGLDPAELQRRPIPDMWSIAEYTNHVREVLFAMRFVLESAVNQPGVDLGDTPEPEFAPTPKVIDMPSALGGIDTEANALREGLGGLAEASWSATAIVGDVEVDASWVCRHALHDASHHLGDVRRLRQALRDARMVRWDAMRSAYDQVAGKYEATFVDELDGKPRDRELLDGFGESMGDPIVDVGCGPGQIGAYIRRRGLYLIGLDISQGMAQRAAHRLDAAVVADMRLLPFASSSLAGLVAFYSIIHVRRSGLVEVLREFLRVLTPGGRVLFSAHQGHGEFRRGEFLGESVPFTATLFDLDELVSATRAAGLEILLAERRAPYPDEHETFRLYVEASKPTVTS